MDNDKQKVVKYTKKAFAVGYLLTFSVWILSCDSPAVFKSYQDLKDASWYVKNTPSFVFEIKDETVPYNIYLMVRNTSKYPYNNLYITRHINEANGKQVSNRLEEITLFEPKTGKPLGKGLGDIYDHKILSSRNFRFPKKGKYTIRLVQYMRQDPLPYLMSVGVSVEKQSPAKQ